MSDIYTVLGEVAGFDVEEDMGKFYEEYVIDSDGEKIRSKKEQTNTEIPNIVGMSIWINYINKKYPTFYESISWNGFLPITISSKKKITAMWIVLSYLFLKWKIYIHTELWEPKYLKNIVFNKAMSDAIIKKVDNGYFYIDKDWLPEINAEKREWWYNEKLSVIFELIFWDNFLKIFELSWDEQRNYFELRTLDYNDWNKISAWRLLFMLSRQLKEMEKTYEEILDCSNN